jgi:hypothetical protein
MIFRRIEHPDCDWYEVIDAFNELKEYENMAKS